MLWWLLVEGDISSWPIGAPAIMAAIVVSMLAGGQYFPHWRFLGALKVFLYFVWKSGVGAIDVARRVFHPRLPLEPVFRDYQLRLPDGHARVFFANVVSLLPGTLSAELHPETLVIHVLDDSRPYLPELRILEERVGNLYGHDVGKREISE